MSPPPRVRTGLDALAADRFAPLRGRTVGAIVHPASVDARMRHLADLLHAAEGVRLAALFGPEHGLRGDAQDLVGVASEHDPRTGVPAYSLYGSDFASLTPAPEQLDGLDALVVDLQDVGSRYYTFAATLLYAMQAAAGRGIEIIVPDRPNPIGGVAIEGPTVRPGFDSFIGAYPMPVRHGLTLGEFARLARAELQLDVELTVVPCQGWSRSMPWPETGLHWVNPSPNMPTFDTALVYPGGCLIEGTNLSEGRGTTRPFELWGAPWLDPHALAAAVADLPGAYARPCGFRPTFHKHEGELCAGVQLHVHDPDAFRPMAAYTRLLALARAQDPGRFAWRTEPYEFVADPIAIDLLYGSARERLWIEAVSDDPPVTEAHDGLAALRGEWAADERDFRERRAPFLLYE